MSNLDDQRERLRTQRPTPWDQLPDFPLYMDQMLSYMDRQVIRFDGADGLTSAMVNNYTKSGLVPRAEGKKYTREHLVYLTVVCILKRVLSARDMGLVFSAQDDRTRLPEEYAAFCQGLDRSLNLVSDMMEAYTEDDAAEAAVHFALLSYAAGLASGRYVQALREQKDAAQAANEEKKPRERHRSARREKEEPDA